MSELTTTTDTVASLTPACRVTDKATGKRYDCYRVRSECSATKSYLVYVYNGLVCHCTCKSRHYNAGKQCKHMRAFQAQLDARSQESTPASTPVVVVAPMPAVTYSTSAQRASAPLGPNRGFSLLRV